MVRVNVASILEPDLSLNMRRARP